MRKTGHIKLSKTDSLKKLQTLLNKGDKANNPHTTYQQLNNTDKSPKVKMVSTPRDRLLTDGESGEQLRRHTGSLQGTLPGRV